LLGYPHTGNEAVIYVPKDRGKHASKPTKLKMQFFYALALMRIESQASLYSEGYTACKQNC